MMTLAFSLCEGSTASGRSPWHIRALKESQEKRFTGGIDTDSLCSHVKAPYGWDLNVSFHDHVHRHYICRSCKDRYDDYLRVGELHFAHEGKKYARIRTVSGLEKQLRDRTARVEWYTLLPPVQDRPFYLLELEMVRRLSNRSNRWFPPEVHRLCIPMENVSVAFIQLLASPRGRACSSTGTNSVRPKRPSGQKTIAASRR